MRKKKVTFPLKLGRGRLSQQKKELYFDLLRNFSEDLEEIQSGLDFHMGARDWCYYLEPMGLKKGDFDWLQGEISKARECGFLRPKFILEEAGHAVTDVYDIDQSAEDYTDEEFEKYEEAEQTFRDCWEEFSWVSFWKDKQYYIQVLVEKIGLKSLFTDICDQYRIPIANLRGWGSIEQKAQMAANFKEKEAEGLMPVLLVCCDHDPPGLRISDTLTNFFEKYLNFTRWEPTNLIIDRFGLNYDFIEDKGLTWIDGLETGKGKDLSDPDHVCYQRNTYDIRGYIKEFGNRKVEANAVIAQPDMGRQLLVDAIEKYIGAGVYAEYEKNLDMRKKEIKALIKTKLEEM